MLTVVNLLGLPFLPVFVLGQQGHHNAMMLSQLWVLNHLAPGGDLSVVQRHPQWDSVVSLHLLKCPVLHGCLHIRRRDLASCMRLANEQFKWAVTGGMETLCKNSKENSHSGKVQKPTLPSGQERFSVSWRTSETQASHCKHIDTWEKGKNTHHDLWVKVSSEVQNCFL